MVVRARGVHLADASTWIQQRIGQGHAAAVGQPATAGAPEVGILPNDAVEVAAGGIGAVDVDDGRRARWIKHGLVRLNDREQVVIERRMFHAGRIGVTCRHRLAVAIEAGDGDQVARDVVLIKHAAAQIVRDLGQVAGGAVAEDHRPAQRIYRDRQSASVVVQKFQRVVVQVGHPA